MKIAILISAILAFSSVVAGELNEMFEHENVKGGMPIARQWCEMPDRSLNDTMIFEFDNEGTKTFLEVNCRQILEYFESKKVRT